MRVAAPQHAIDLSGLRAAHTLQITSLLETGCPGAADAACTEQCLKSVDDLEGPYPFR